MPNQSVQNVVDEVAKAKGVMASAVTYIKSVPALVQAAIDQALQNGATAEELAPLTQVVTDLQEQEASLTEALSSGSPGSNNPFPSA